MTQHILSKYLSKKVYVNFFGFFAILVIIFFGNQFYIVAKESLKIGLFDFEILPFLQYKIIRDLHELITISFIGSITLTLLKITKTSEKAIFHLAGFSDFSLIKLLQRPLIIFLIFNICLSFFASPYAKQKLLDFKDNASNRPEFIFLKQNQFQSFDKYVFYSPYINTNEQNQIIEDIFLFSDLATNQIVISANKGVKYFDSLTGNIYLDLTDGHLYKNISDTLIESISKFNSLKLKIYDSTEKNKLEQKDEIETYDIFKLLGINSYESHAEISYRISQPILMFLLVFFSVLLSGTNARSFRSYSIFLMLLIYIAYNNFIIFTKQLIIYDSYDPFLAFILPHAIFIGIIIIIKIIKNRIFT